MAKHLLELTHWDKGTLDVKEWEFDENHYPQKEVDEFKKHHINYSIKHYNHRSELVNQIETATVLGDNY